MTEEVTQAAEIAPVEEVKQDTPAPEAKADDQAEAATADTEEAAAPEESGDDAAEEKPKKKGGFQKRISELTREKYEADIRASEAERRFNELMAKQAPSVPTSEPKAEDFTTLDEWAKVHTQWVQSETKKQMAQEQEARAEHDRAISVKATMQAREAEARTRYTDFDQVIAPVAPIIMGNPALRLYASKSENAMDVAYHLAKNPERLIEISRMELFDAAREILKIEERIKNPPPKPVTNAPKPIKPVGSNETRQPSLEDLPMAEYARRRREERNRKG